MILGRRHAFQICGRLAELFLDRRANVAIIFSLSAPVMLMLAGGAVDFARVRAAKTSLQSLADAAALAGVQSLRLANATGQTAGQVVGAYVSAQSSSAGAPIAAATNVGSGNTSVSIQLDQDVPISLLKMAGINSAHVQAKAQARLVGGSLPNCMVALEPSASGATAIDKATLMAPGCTIYSDSSATDSLTVTNGAKISSGQTCSHGGFKADALSSISPSVQLDCPLLADPLAARTPPAVGACTQNNMKITHGSTSLTPGIYCGGLEISGNANVTLLAGTYVIKDGQFLLKAGSTVSGTDVTMFLTGTGATLAVENKSSVSLTAPAAGGMAGLLIFEDRSAPLGQTHKFESRNAPNMLGTIYLSRGNLEIGVKGGGGGSGTAVGATSAWTIVVARQIAINDQQQLTLNTNYSATVVQPPAGLGPGAVSPQLVQ